MSNQVPMLSVGLCRANPEVIYVFGDNLIHRGKAGQAIIRDEPNAFGIPTKRLPSMDSNAFFADRLDEFRAVRQAMDKLDELSKTNKIVFPSAGVGTGLAKMKENSPTIYFYLQERLKRYLCA